VSPDDCPGTRHGTPTAYQRYGCRCDDARAAQSRYRKQLRYRHHRGVPTKIAGYRVRRRFEALMALGWPRGEIYRRMGYSDSSWIDRDDRERVSAAVFAKVCAVYDELSMQVGPSQQTRSFARNRGYAPPLAWDDIDDPDEQPKGLGRTHVDDVDDAVVARVLAGERLPTTPAERREITARWPGSLAELERRFGWKANRYKRSA
jgi:hypothetical protein